MAGEARFAQAETLGLRSIGEDPAKVAEARKCADDCERCWMENRCPF